MAEVEEADPPPEDEAEEAAAEEEEAPEGEDDGDEDDGEAPPPEENDGAPPEEDIDGDAGEEDHGGGAEETAPDMTQAAEHEVLPEEAAYISGAAGEEGWAAAGEGAEQDATHDVRDGFYEEDGAFPPEDDSTFLDYVADQDIVRVYEDACQNAGRKPSHLIMMSLAESVQAARDTFSIIAPGSHKLAFTSRQADEDMAVFASVFAPPARHLLTLDLSYNLLTDAGAATLASGLLAGCSRLASLSVRSNTIGAQGCEHICRALRGRSTLVSLDLSHNPLGRDGGLHVVDLLRVSPRLLHLHLQDTEADIDVLVAIAEALLSNKLMLRVCNMENPRILTLQEDHTVHLGRMLRVNTHLNEVYLGKVKMRDDGVRQLVDFLLENKVLRVLDLRCNELGADGARHLGKLLAADCQLSRLNVSSNRIGEKGNIAGAKAIADALVKNRMLQHLDLNGNLLCGAALKVIADAVDQNSTLETLGLFQNQWDQPSSYKFHQILNDRARILPLRADFITSEVDLRIDICRVDGFDSR